MDSSCNFTTDSHTKYNVGLAVSLEIRCTGGTNSSAVKAFIFYVFQNTVHAERNTHEGQVQVPGCPPSFSVEIQSQRCCYLPKLFCLVNSLQAYLLYHFLYPYILISYIPLFLILCSFCSSCWFHPQHFRAANDSLSLS